MILFPISRKAERYARKHGNNFYVRFGPAPVHQFDGGKGYLVEPYENPSDGFWIPYEGNSDWSFKNPYPETKKSLPRKELPGG